MPFHEVEGCDGIFYGGVTDVGSARLNSPPEVFFDSKRASQATHPPNVVLLLEGQRRTNLAMPV